MGENDMNSDENDSRGGRTDNDEVKFAYFFNPLTKL